MVLRILLEIFSNRTKIHALFFPRCTKDFFAMSLTEIC